MTLYCPMALNPSKCKLPTGATTRWTIKKWKYRNRHRTSVGNAWMFSVGIALVGFLIAACIIIMLINAPALAEPHLMLCELDKKTTMLLHHDKRKYWTQFSKCVFCFVFCFRFVLFVCFFFCFRSSLSENIYMLNERLANLSIQKVQKSPFEYLHLHTLTYKP